MWPQCSSCLVHPIFGRPPDEVTATAVPTLWLHVGRICIYGNHPSLHLPRPSYAILSVFILEEKVHTQKRAVKFEHVSVLSFCFNKHMWKWIIRNLFASKASLQEGIHQVLLVSISSKNIFYGLHERVIHWIRITWSEFINSSNPVVLYAWYIWLLILLWGMSSALNTFRDRVAHRRVTPAGSSRLLSMSSWSSFPSLFSTCNMGERAYENEQGAQPPYFHEGRGSGSRRYRFCQSYRRLISSSHNKEADFEVAFSPGAGVIWVIQQKPLPQDTVGWNGTCKRVYKTHQVKDTKSTLK